MSQSERLAAEKFCRDNDLPLTGYVCLHNGKPFQWQHNRPRPQSVMPGVVAMCLDDGSRFIAIGGSIDGGANQWEDAAEFISLTKAALDRVPPFRRWCHRCCWSGRKNCKAIRRSILSPAPTAS